MKKKGFSLIEIVVYVAIVTIIFIVVVNTTTSVIETFARARALKNVSIGGGVALERILREARLAENIDLSTSVFGVNPGILKLNTVQASGDDTPVTRTFFLDEDSSQIVMSENEGPGEALTREGEVTKLVFYRIDGSLLSEAVRIEITMRDGNGVAEVTKNFYATVVLRRSY